MRRRNYILWIEGSLLSMAFAACSQEQVADDVGGRMAVGFQTYLSRSTTSQATTGSARPAVALSFSNGAASMAVGTRDASTTPYYNIETAADLQQVGLGAFAFTTGETDYTAGQTTWRPNFMYNQQVTYNGSTKTWDYLPTLFWPETKVSFFAYAPYAASATQTLTAMNGETSFAKGKESIGDPTVSYQVAGSPLNSVDLLWATVPPSTENQWTAADGTTTTLTEGLPWLNIRKPSVSARLKFYFRHALAKINLQAEYVVDNASSADALSAANTLVLIDSIYAEGDAGLPASATLSLCNTTASVPLWSQAAGTAKVTIGASALNGKLASASVTNESSFQAVKSAGGGLPMIVEGGSDAATDVLTPVTTPAGNASTAALMLIPTSAASLSSATLRVTVVYTIVTYDKNLIYNNPPYLAFTRRQRVSGTCSFAGGLVAGRAYNVRLKVGLRALRFQVDADNWQELVAFTPAVYPWTLGDGSNKNLTIEK